MLSKTQFTAAQCFMCFVLICFTGIRAKANDGRHELYNPTKPDGYNFVGETVYPNQKYVLRKGRDSQYLICMYVSGRLRYILRDPAIERYASREVIPSGESGQGYHFFLSPDNRSLLVIRSCYHGYVVAYIYRLLKNNRAVLVAPHGCRLDEAAMRYYAHHRRLSATCLDQGEREIAFVGWKDLDTVTFHEYSASIYDADQMLTKPKKICEASWTMDYNIVSNKFRIVSNDPF